MCRIAGIYNPQSDSLERDILSMRDAMHRGGPDDAGVFLHPELPFALGHRRLSLLDLTPAGHQPMTSADGKLKLIFNGEIYNFRELRQELKRYGYSFSTQTDTEVIIYSYQQWGKDCFSRFNGMFALAILDEERKELVLARDHAGIKPLYYYLAGDLFVFASEIRAFKALPMQWKAEDVWRSLFLLFGHLPEPFTTLDGVRCLEKGHSLTVQLPSLVSQKYEYHKANFDIMLADEEAALEYTRDILPKAVQRHLISDAPIGLFLSGGIDSSLLTLLASPILGEQLKTLSIEFAEAEYSEEVYQKIVIGITNAHHRSFQVSKQDFERALPDILEAMDQPSIDAINTYFISMYARQCGLKAVLSGLGADELFGGYPSFQRFRNWKYLSYIPKFISEQAGRFSSNKLSKLSYDKYHPMLSLYLMNRGLNSVNRVSQITETPVGKIEEALAAINVPDDIDYSSPNANAAMEQHLYMKNQLLKDADYMGMWHGLEIRVPFLDKELINAINSLSPVVKFRSDIPKALLIEAFATLLPAEIWKRKKQGFTFPFAYWLKQCDGLKPTSKAEQETFDLFDAGAVHWSRYWALKVAGMEKW